MNRCKNCATELTDRYCPRCGQKASTDRITFAYVAREFFHALTDLERGFFHTSLRMLVAPGRTAKDFIDGKRSCHRSPVPYFLIWTTVYILFLYWTEAVFGKNAAIDYREYFGPDATTRFAISHLSVVLIAVMPFQTLYLWRLITHTQYHYVESMVATIYSLGTVILLQFTFSVSAVLVHTTTGATVDLQLSDVFKVGYLVWFTADFVRLFPVNHKPLRAAAFVVLAFGTFTLWRLYGLPTLMHVVFFTSDH